MEDTSGVDPRVGSILEAARDRRGSDDRVSVAANPLPAAFERAGRDGRVPVIAEIKPTSPTTDGDRREDPVALAERMVAGGAAALSVLTEPDHFGGDPADLRRVRDAVDVPVLRKDFVLSESQLDVVRADAILLIARFVDDLAGMIAAARDRGFQVLVETHTREEVEAALAADARILGINNRDLASLTVDLGTFERVAAAVPAGTTLIAESGIQRPEDARRMCRAGADGLLVGSAIMDGDVRTNTSRLVDATRGAETPDGTGTAGRAGTTRQTGDEVTTDEP